MTLRKETLISLEIRELTAALCTILVKEARKRRKLVTVLKILIENITKILRLKIIKTPTEMQKYYCLSVKPLTPFKRDMAAKLPPHHPGINYAFRLEKNKNT